MVKNKDKQYMFDGQHDDEETIYVFKRHPIVMRKGLIAILLGMLPGLIYLLVRPPLYPSFTDFLPVVIGMALGGLFLFHQWIGWYYTVYIVTDQRFITITQKGLFSRTVSDISLDRIQSINFQVEGIQETLLGFGTILVQTFVGDMVLENIHHPAKVQERIVKIIKELGYSDNDTPF